MFFPNSCWKRRWFLQNTWSGLPSVLTYIAHSHFTAPRSVNNQNIIIEKHGVEPDDDTTKTRHKLHLVAHSIITPIVELELGRCDVMRRSPPSAKWLTTTPSSNLSKRRLQLLLVRKEGGKEAGIFFLKHESSIFRSFIQPCMWFWKCQTSSPEAKQYIV